MLLLSDFKFHQELLILIFSLSKQLSFNRALLLGFNKKRGKYEFIKELLITMS